MALRSAHLALATLLLYAAGPGDALRSDIAVDMTGAASDAKAGTLQHRNLLQDPASSTVGKVQAIEHEANADVVDAMIDGAFNAIKGGPPSKPNAGAVTTPGDPPAPPNFLARRLQQDAIKGIENIIERLPGILAGTAGTYDGVSNPATNQEIHSQGRKLLQDPIQGVKNIVQRLPGILAGTEGTYDGVSNPATNQENGGQGRRLQQNPASSVVGKVQAIEDEANADVVDAIIDGAFNAVKGAPPSKPNAGAVTTPGDPPAPPNFLGRK